MDVADRLLPAIAGEDFARLRGVLARLALAPPQTLLLEGGDETARQELARYWACACNCPQALAAAARGEPAAPCLACPVCAQIAAGEHLDVLAFDGRIGNREDEENPGPVMAFNMRRARELKSRLRDAPHGPGRRVVLLMGLSPARDEAANALLKALEEPSAHTVFVLLAAQREQLLPTLVSRSFCLTLPWSETATPDAGLDAWEAALADFLHTGRGFLEKAAARGGLDAPQAARLLLSCQRALVHVLAGGASTGAPGPLADALAPLLAAGGKASPVHRAALCGRWLDEAQEMLRYGVAPARVLEGFASRLFVLLRGEAAA
ncbi:DNA polymerase III subunit delta' [Desulfovibrio sp.]|uniref:DNA polymerase III subunit delta' n=1 Tax=Desulfovibrio sp. TaxID=885 RepID=UPI0023C380FE|nr:DNA polymerase III subunit delta' [Desulfovibrio sp.]MDE7242347.1 DNA polymerase III subunit delta' [Desulfovibrio sp.]